MRQERGPFDISLSHPPLVNNTKGGTAYLVGPTAALKISPKIQL
jgi:hypothetical protein